MACFDVFHTLASLLYCFPIHSVFAPLTDAVGSRKEAGCLRFDVLRCPKQANKFFFYEIYVDAAAIEVHKAQPHFKAWTDFKVCFTRLAAFLSYSTTSLILPRNHDLLVLTQHGYSATISLLPYL